MKYATWNLKFNEESDIFTGPEQSILDQGFSIKPICSIGSLDTHSILGQFSDNNENLSLWDFNEISRESAIALYSENFIPIEAEPESNRPAFTLDMAVNSIFSVE